MMTQIRIKHLDNSNKWLASQPASQPASQYNSKKSKQSEKLAYEARGFLHGLFVFIPLAF